MHENNSIGAVRGKRLRSPTFPSIATLPLPAPPQPARRRRPSHGKDMCIWHAIRRFESYVAPSDFERAMPARDSKQILKFSSKLSSWLEACLGKYANFKFSSKFSSWMEMCLPVQSLSSHAILGADLYGLHCSLQRVDDLKLLHLKVRNYRNQQYSF